VKLLFHVDLWIPQVLDVSLWKSI